MGGLSARHGIDDDAPRLEDVVAALLIVAAMCRWPESIPVLVLASCLLCLLRHMVTALIARMPLSMGCVEEPGLHRPLRLVAVVVCDNDDSQALSQ